MSAIYSLERWRHGWLLCGADAKSGVPMDALSQIQSLFGPKALIDAGIVAHLRAMGKRNAAMCIVEGAAGAAWRAEIVQTLASLPPQERWWKGLDTGASSSAIFAVFCEGRFRADAADAGRGAAPRDADDFGRCSRLLALFPEWKANLHRVAETHPSTSWPTLVSRWDEIEAASPDRKNQILGRL